VLGSGFIRFLPSRETLRGGRWCCRAFPDFFCFQGLVVIFLWTLRGKGGIGLICAQPVYRRTDIWWPSPPLKRGFRYAGEGYLKSDHWDTAWRALPPAGLVASQEFDGRFDKIRKNPTRPKSRRVAPVGCWLALRCLLFLTPRFYRWHWLSRPCLSVGDRGTARHQKM